MYIVQVFYSLGNAEFFGTFPSFEQARSWAQGLKMEERNAKVVVAGKTVEVVGHMNSYNVLTLNRIA